MSHLLESDMKSDTLFPDLHPDNMFCQIVLRCAAKFLHEQDPQKPLALQFFGLYKPSTTFSCVQRYFPKPYFREVALSDRK